MRKFLSFLFAAMCGAWLLVAVQTFLRSDNAMWPCSAAAIYTFILGAWCAQEE